MQQEQQPLHIEVAVGRITLDDVRNVLGETSPFDTNASRIREALGRGSNATIQKYLDSLRQERIAAAQPHAEPAITKAPDDLVALIWGAACTAAQAQTLSRLEKVSAERDTLLLTTQAQQADIAELTGQLDDLEDRADQHFQTLTEAQNRADAAARDIEAVKLAQQNEIDALRAELARVTENAEHAARTAKLEAQIERQAMQSTIDRLTDQVGDLKAFLASGQTKQPAPKKGQQEPVVDTQTVDMFTQDK